MLISVGCSDPGEVANAERRASDRRPSYNVGDTIRYECISSCFTGGGVRRCEGNNVWSDSVACIGELGTEVCKRA